MIYTRRVVRSSIIMTLKVPTCPALHHFERFLVVGVCVVKFKITFKICWGVCQCGIKHNLIVEQCLLRLHMLKLRSSFDQFMQDRVYMQDTGLLSLIVCLRLLPFMSILIQHVAKRVILRSLKFLWGNYFFDWGVWVWGFLLIIWFFANKVIYSTAGVLFSPQSFRRRFFFSLFLIILCWILSFWILWRQNLLLLSVIDLSDIIE